MICNYIYVFAGYLFLWNSMVFEVHKSNRAKSLMNMISQLFHSITIFPHGTLVLQTHRAEVNNRNPRNVGRHLEQHLTRPQSSLIISIWRGSWIGVEGCGRAATTHASARARGTSSLQPISQPIFFFFKQVLLLLFLSKNGEL